MFEGLAGAEAVVVEVYTASTTEQGEERGYWQWPSWGGKDQGAERTWCLALLGRPLGVYLWS